MVSREKVLLMTKAAIFEKKEKKRDLKVVEYRRRDYILSRMILLFLAMSLGYAIIVGAIFFMIVMAYSTIVLNLPQMMLIIAAVVLVYIVLVILYYMIGHRVYGERHVKARRNVKEYMDLMKKLKDINEGERVSYKENEN